MLRFTNKYFFSILLVLGLFYLHKQKRERMEAGWHCLLDDKKMANSFSTEVTNAIEAVYVKFRLKFGHWEKVMCDRNARAHYLLTRLGKNYKRIVEKAEGIYGGLTFTLTACVKLHEKRWEVLHKELQNVTRGAFIEFSKKCFTLSQIVVVIVIMKCRLIFGEVPNDFVEFINQLSVPSINRNLDWPSVLEQLYGNATHAKTPIGVELQEVYRRYVEVLLTAMSRNPNLFEFEQPVLKDLYSMSSLEEAQKRVESYPPARRMAMTLGLLSEKTLLEAADNKVLVFSKSLKIIQDMEANRLVDFITLLLQVQLTARCLTSWKEGGDPQVNQSEIPTLYADMELLSIVNISGTNDVIDLFKYPLSLYRGIEGKQVIYFTCEVVFGDKKTSYFPQLELPVAYYLFGRQNNVMFVDALFSTMVTKQMRQFLRLTEVVTLEDGSIIPKNWLTLPEFEGMQVDESV
jgi:hypothetical protein